MKANANTEIAPQGAIEFTAIEKVQPEDKPAARPRQSISRFKATCAFLRNGTCSKTLMTLIDEKFGHPMKPEEQATDPLAGGMMQGYQCGMLWGSTLAAGAEAHRRFGAGPQAEAAAMRAAERVVEAFRARHGHIDCIDITETDPKDKWKTFVHFFLKGGTVTCARRIANTAGEAYDAISSGLDETPKPTGGCEPASCASKLIRMMGGSEQQATMAAGLAGGLGFSGGGCGALGAAIWLIGVKMRAQGAENKAIKVRIEQTIERFLKTTRYEFECKEIVGREFDGIADHAAHVRSAGCAELIETLAAAAQEAQNEQRHPQLLANARS